MASADGVDVEPATKYEATYLIGYDAEKRGLVEFDFNTFGAATYRTSVGWREGILTMDSRETSSPARFYAADRFVYTITASVFTVDWQMRRQHDSDWSTSDHFFRRAKQRA